MHLTSPTVEISNPAPLSTSFSDKMNPSANASSSDPALQIPTASARPGSGKPKILPDLWIGNMKAVEETIDLRQSINSIDMGFTLIDQNNAQRSPSITEVGVICDMYPGVSRVLHLPPYLHVVCDKIPEQVPRTLAGIPCRFTTNLTEIPLCGTFCRGPAISVGTVCRPWILPPFDTRKEIAQLLVSRGVRSVGWLGTRWLLEVESEDDNPVRNLPRTINGLVVSYRCLPPSQEHSRRHIFPSRTEVDNTNYFPNLHFGMLVFQGDGYTTSGCPVKHVDYPEDRFFTVASHGCVLGAEIAHPHAPPDGRIVAIVDKQIGYSDISLAKIVDPAVKYTPEAFAGTDGTIRLKKLRKEQDCMLARELFLDSPFTGLGTGIIIGHGVDVYPKDGIDGTDDKWAFVSNIWTDFASGDYGPVAGCCGTPLYDKDGEVMGFFRWFDDGGVSRCPTPDPLINAGWELANYEPSDALIPADTEPR
jgi:hypothetical protein